MLLNVLHTFSSFFTRDDDLARKINFIRRTHQILFDYFDKTAQLDLPELQALLSDSQTKLNDTEASLTQGEAQHLDWTTGEETTSNLDRFKSA